MGTKSYTKARYAGLWAPESFWFRLETADPSLFNEFNGVGSEDSWTYHLTPDTIWGLDITPASDIHDDMYTQPRSFGTDAEGIEWKNKADRAFRNNLIRLFEKAEAESWWARRLAWLRRRRAQEYFEILQNFGGSAFWSGKNKPSEMGEAAA